MNARMLNGVLTLHDIADTEAFCARIIHRQRPDLPPHELEDRLAYLIETAWELSRTWQPGGLTFSTWAGTTLRRRLTDYERQRNGRTTWKFATHTYTRPRPILTRLDDHQPHGHRDDAADRATSLDGLLRTRDRQTPRPNHTRGEDQTRPAARRAA